MASLSLRRRLALEAWRIMRHSHAHQHPLRQLFWECTLRCNLSCMHCGSDCKHETSTPDMPAEDFLRVIDTITPKVNPHQVMIIITGGEPLLRRDLEEVGHALYRRGYPWGIVTNGLALTPQRFESLRRAGLHSITVSLDGLPDDHNWLRGHKLSFDRAYAAAKMIEQAEDLERDIVTCVNRRNFSRLPEIRDMLINAGIKRWRLFTIFPMGRAAEHLEFRLQKDEFLGLMEFIKNTRAEGKIHASYCCEGFLGNYEGEVRDNFYVCNAGISVASIRIDGAISGCLSIRADYDQGNIYADDFMEVWKTRFSSYRDRRWMRSGRCAACKMWRYCEGNGFHLRESDGSLIGCQYFPGL